MIYLLLIWNLDLIYFIFIEKDVKGTQIPYKNWHIQEKYAVENWPNDVTFQDYNNIKNEKDKKKVLSALKDIKFIKLG